MLFPKINCWLKYVGIIATVALVSCSSDPVFEDPKDLNGADLSFYTQRSKSYCLVSDSVGAPENDSIANLPVFVASHGFSATPYEWEEFRAFADSLGDVYVSLVLMEGHGQDYEDFRKTPWDEWADPIVDEYQKLRALGWKNIHLLCASTSCPLLLDRIVEDEIVDSNAPKSLTMIDPIVVPGSKLLSAIGLVGPMMGSVETECTDAEKSFWHCLRPQEALQELMDLLDLTRLRLESGIVAPKGTQVRVYKSHSDGSADPLSAVLLWKGIETDAANKEIFVEMISSKLHVFTRLQGRENVSTQDKESQQTMFKRLVDSTYQD